MDSPFALSLEPVILNLLFHPFNETKSLSSRFIKMSNNKTGLTEIFVTVFSLIVLLIMGTVPGYSQVWSAHEIKYLSDDCFAVIEIDENGDKVRHCPYCGLDGEIDNEQLIYVLGSLDSEKWIDPTNSQIARKHLENHYNRLIKKLMKNGLHDPININTAKLFELVMLPHIGPVLAVKIVKFRDANSRYKSIENIRNVEGIGQGTFNAIRHYITVD